MNKLLNGLKENANVKYTENGAIARSTTGHSLYDMFAFGGAYRSRSEEDCILLFKNAFEENPEYAVKCLFYLRDIVEGQGQRRFFRICLQWLANEHPEVARRNLEYVSELGRWDDLYCLVKTPVEKDVFNLIKHQLALDVKSLRKPNGAVSLCGKWLCSENATSAETRKLGTITRNYLGMTSRQYRKTLSALRKRINVLERLMSANEWDKIDFSAIPSQAGLKYRKAFQRHDIDRKKANPKAQTYEEFANDASTTVNAKALNPYEVVQKAVSYINDNTIYGYWNAPRRWRTDIRDIERLMINKYWDNLTDYFKDANFDGLCVCDTSGSMTCNNALPLSIAISLSMYCAERARGPFTGHYISFSRRARLVKVEGVDFVDKVKRIYETDLCENTNLESVFDLLLDTAYRNNCSQEDLPKTIIIISDQEFDAATSYNYSAKETLMENIMKKWQAYGYKCPKLYFWNVNAKNNTIAMTAKNGITFVSGSSPVLFKQILTGKTAMDLMFDKLNEERYSKIY